MFGIDGCAGAAGASAHGQSRRVDWVLIGGVGENWGFVAMVSMFRAWWDGGWVETGTEISGSRCMGVSGNVMKQCRELWRNPKSERSGGGLGWGEARLGAPGVDLFAATTRLGSPTR